MAELSSIFLSLDSAINELDILLEEANSASEHENFSAVRLQRLFRGWRTRVVIYEKNLAATEIERVVRGHAGRLICHRKYEEKASARSFAIFQYFALQLQKCFRGYYSRKYRQNHHLRKLYLQNVKTAGERVRQSMEDYANKIRQDEEDKAYRENQDHFNHLTENLHHLVSTRQIPGVYNPRVNLMNVPTVNEVPVESYLRGAVKDLLKTKGLTKTGLVRDLNGTLKVPLKGMKNRLSLQASVPYDVLEKERTRERIRHKIAMAGKDNDFTCGGRTTLIDNKVEPLCVDDPYMDQWSNPLLMRGVPRNQKAMISQAQSRTTAVTFHPEPKVPFYKSVSGNKSVVLPNNLFDTIADAEENGGVTKRHIARTARFGLTENCDNRVIGGTLPVPPIKSATLVPTKRTVRAQRVKSKILSSTAPLIKQRVPEQQVTNPFDDSSDEDN